MLVFSMLMSWFLMMRVLANREAVRNNMSASFKLIELNHVAHIGRMKGLVDNVGSIEFIIIYATI